MRSRCCSRHASTAPVLIIAGGATLDEPTDGMVSWINATSTHAVFSAAQRLGLQRVVWASSETTLGLPFDTPPEYAPVDEKHIRPEFEHMAMQAISPAEINSFKAKMLRSGLSPKTRPRG